MSQLILLKKKKKERTHKKMNQIEKLKQIEFGFKLTKELNNPNTFQIAGDLTINIDSFLNNEFAFMNLSMNEFIQVKQIRSYDEYDFMDIFMDTDIYVRSDMSVPIQILRRCQRQDLFDLANVMEEYQQLLNEKQNLNCNLLSQEQQQQKTTQPDTQSEFICDEAHGWNIQKSVQKAEIEINKLKESMKNQDCYYTFIIFKGNKYDQSVYRVGYSLLYLKNLYFLNDYQINHLTYRKPIINFIKYQSQMVQYQIGRIKNQIKYLKKEKDLDYYRTELKFLGEFTSTTQSVDNYCIDTKMHTYQYILSNYQNQVDDVLLINVHQPIRGWSVSQIVKGMRNLKKYLSEEQQSSNLNPFFNGNLYSDVIYEAQAELFKDKFYSVSDNYLYHSILQNL
ncbi:hypothetical protein TTHERM_00753370 (macronuclear) [Tetrahymena thermophila SB210]|uniref:Uncharacterized protein n=1 Tax=Tetrahymena thermophila (strain SB210) TaxID=312017 RepID=Q23NI3_TETTS|nr:hypothetical protein TTHERM_00753370 [Tetrahymena thermophila SB210]EAR98091.1 hypothetical protein TTHERM_00753370 [Tetrahymena thermophila SB210]|eukprot:XP_001018336.1 hypothetical protein TTHERM_00753370 [Tetrahymena thermophila SB210]